MDFMDSLKDEVLQGVKRGPFYPPLYASHFCNFLNDLIEFYFEVNSTFCMQYSEVMYFYF